MSADSIIVALFCTCPDFHLQQPMKANPEQHVSKPILLLNDTPILVAKYVQTAKDVVNGLVIPMGG